MYSKTKLKFTYILKILLSSWWEYYFIDWNPHRHGNKFISLIKRANCFLTLFSIYQNRMYINVIKSHKKWNVEVTKKILDLHNYFFIWRDVWCRPHSFPFFFPLWWTIKTITSSVQMEKISRTTNSELNKWHFFRWNKYRKHNFVL